MLDPIKKDTQTRMQKSVDALKHDLTRLRTGRASTALVEPLKISYYGADTPISQIANVALADARSITITPFEKSLVALVEKAILASDLGLTPNTVGNVIRINLPALTEERRRELAKLANKYAEGARIAVRNVRRDGMETLKEDEKKKEISEDDRKRSEDEVQKLTDRYVAEVDQVAAAKEKEILQY